MCNAFLPKFFRRLFNHELEAFIRDAQMSLRLNVDFFFWFTPDFEVENGGDTIVFSGKLLKTKKRSSN